MVGVAEPAIPVAKAPPPPENTVTVIVPAIVTIPEQWIFAKRLIVKVAPEATVKLL